MYKYKENIHYKYKKNIYRKKRNFEDEIQKFRSHFE